MTMTLNEQKSSANLARLGSGDDLMKLFLDIIGGNVAGPQTVADDQTVAGAQDVAGIATVGGLVLSSVAVTATADGLTTGIIPATAAFVEVTSANATHIVALPAPVVGQVLILRNGATGYELRSSAPATIAINGGTGASAESAIAASTMVVAVCTTATTWQAFSLVGTTFAAVEAAA